MQRPLRILSLGLQTLVAVVAVGMVSVLFVPRLLGWELATVRSGSMSPTYPVQSVLALRPVDPADIKVGDVITFVARGQVVTHRVVTVESTSGGSEFVTKGDANDDPDLKPVPASAVRGRVVYGIPMVGWLVGAGRTPVGFTLLLVLPALVLLAPQLSKRVRLLRHPEPIVEESTS